MSKVEKVDSVDDEPPTPWPILGNTYVKTNTSRSGCMMVRMANTPIVLRSTRRSRRSRAQKAARDAERTGRKPIAPRIPESVMALIRAAPCRSG